VSPNEDHFSFRGLSPDGSKLAIGFSGGPDSSRGTYLLDLSRGTRERIEALNNGGSFSFDGRNLVAAINRGGRRWDLVELDFETRQTHEIAPDSAPDFLPSYSPSGRYIVFNSYRTGRSDLYLYERATRALTRLTTFDGYDAHAQFSPDEQSIVFHREVTRGNYDLILLDLRTMAERSLTSAPGEESYPAFSPDGRYIAYSDDRDTPGKPDIFIYSLADNSAARLTSGGNSDTYANWSRDGRFISFNSRRTGRTGIYRVAMDGPRCRALR
jgi:TolB protein